MTTLCLDTSTAMSSVAIGTSEYAFDAPRGHAEHLAGVIREALADNDLTIQDIDRIVVGVGPGLYTGLRVGVVTATMMGLAADIPVTGVCSLDGLGFAVGDGVVVTDARRREVFAAQYRAGQRVGDPIVATPDDVLYYWPDDVITGPAVAVYPQLGSQSAPLSILEFPRVIQTLPVRAWYLRDPDATPAGAR